MKLTSALFLVSLPILFMACGRAESHDRLLTHPPKIYGEYVTRLATTIDFARRDIPVGIPGRRPEFETTPLNHNVILVNRKHVIDITVINPDDQPLAPHTVTVIFYDGPEGHSLDSQSLVTGVIPPQGRQSASLATSLAPSSGITYWSYSISRADDWEAALQTYQESRQEEGAEVQADDDLEWDDDEDWEEDWQ